jgi:hypothetical protein
MQPISLTPEQQREAQAIDQKLLTVAPERLQQMAQLLASKSESEFFGKTEFELRELLNALGTDLLNTARQERKKGATEDPRASAFPAEAMPDSSGTPREP